MGSRKAIRVCAGPCQVCESWPAGGSAQPNVSASARARSGPIPGTASHSSGPAAMTAVTLPKSSNPRADAVETPRDGGEQPLGRLSSPAWLGSLRVDGPVGGRLDALAAHRWESRSTLPVALANELLQLQQPERAPARHGAAAHSAVPSSMIDR